MSQGSTLTRFADLALGVALPIHSHIAVNNVISDYVPKNVAGEPVVAL
jgi:succinate dehydrogenase (ubiquinone) membrane anchor subunit